MDGRSVTCGCWRRCPAGSTPRSPPPGPSTPGTTSPGCTWRCPRPGRAARRRPRLLHAGGRRRRPPGADVLGIPFYVWDLAERFDETWSTTSSPSTPPGARRTPACAATRRSSSPRCWTGRWRWASTRSCTGHYARLAPAAVLRRAVDLDKDQSYVLGVLDRRSAGARDVPARRLDQAGGPGRGRRGAGCGSPTSPTATTSASSRRRHPGFLRERLGARAGRHRRRRRPARCWPGTAACTASRSASARGWR